MPLTNRRETLFKWKHVDNQCLAGKRVTQPCFGANKEFCHFKKGNSTQKNYQSMILIGSTVAFSVNSIFALIYLE